MLHFFSSPFLRYAIFHITFIILYFIQSSLYAYSLSDLISCAQLRNEEISRAECIKLLLCNFSFVQLDSQSRVAWWWWRRKEREKENSNLLFFSLKWFPAFTGYCILHKNEIFHESKLLFMHKPLMTMNFILWSI